MSVDKIEYRDYPSSKQEAKKLHVDYFFDNKPCPQGHVAMKRVVDGACVRCLHKEEFMNDMLRGE